MFKKFYRKQLSHLAEKDNIDAGGKLIIFCPYTEFDTITYRKGNSLAVL